MPLPSLRVAEAVLLVVIALGLLYGLAGLAAWIVTLREGAELAAAAARVERDPMALGFVQLVALGAALTIGVARVHGARTRLTEALSIRQAAPLVIALAVIAGAAMQFTLTDLAGRLASAIPSLARDPTEEAALEALLRIDGARRAIAVPFAFVVVAPLTEELFFRGLLLPALAPRSRPGGALNVTSILFGALHVVPLAAITATLAGLVLGWLALRTRSVLPSLAFHAAFNAAPVILQPSMVAIPGFNAEGDHLALPLVLSASVVAAATLTLVHRATQPAG